MNSLGIVARAVLMEAEDESRAKKYGRRAAYGVGAGVGGLGALGAYRGYKAGRSMGQGAMDTIGTMGRGASASIRRPVAALRPVLSRAKSAASQGVSGIKSAMQSGYARAAQFAGDNTPNIIQFPARGVAAGLQQGVGVKDKLAKAGKWGMGGFKDVSRGQKIAAGALGAAGLAGAGYGAYKMHQKRAKQAAREAYYQTYMSLMEAAEQEQESGIKKWGKRALAAGAMAGAAYGGHKLASSDKYGSARYKNFLAQRRIKQPNLPGTN